MKGKVYLVGAGPGDPELLTVKAVRLLESADAVLYDELVAPEILSLVPARAQRHNVGKRCGTKRIQQQEINFLMIALADSGLRVVRLKSGDPSIFGRAGEEMESLRRAGIPYEVVPGVTSALGAAAAAKMSLTHRQKSSAVVFLTAHHAAEKESADWSSLAGSGATLVIYMPGPNYLSTSTKLKNSGLASDIPCAIVSRATTAQQRIHYTTVGELQHAPFLAAPTLLVVGEVARVADSTLEPFAAKPGTEFSVPAAMFAELPSDARGDEEPIL